MDGLHIFSRAELLLGEEGALGLRGRGGDCSQEAGLVVIFGYLAV